MLDVQKYLNRINYSGPLYTSYETLARLQEHHLKAVPFENLDVHYGYPIILNVCSFYNKIVNNQRGGFCYELNGLFHSLLKNIGFNARIVSARVFDDESKSYSPEFDHLAILVDICDNTWLVDVGFGDYIYHPLEIESNKIQEDPNGLFKVKSDQSEFIIERKAPLSGDWELEYKFEQQEKKLSEFHERCMFHQTSKESHVSQKKICSLVTSDGRITLTDNKFKVTKKNLVQESKIKSEKVFQEYLQDYFGIIIEK